LPDDIDAAGVRRWLQTGSSGPVAGAALEYERRAAETYDGASDRSASEELDPQSR